MQEKATFKKRYDAVIIGARCAGASLAILLARAGVDVLLVDRQAYGSDTASTHAMMRAGVLQLDRWGLLPEVMNSGTPPVTETIFHYIGEAVPIRIKPDFGVSHLCAPRRYVLDRLLVDAAAAAGADVRHGVTLTELDQGTGGKIGGVIVKDAGGSIHEVRSDIVIGADGRQSSVARFVGAPIYRAGRHASGYAYGYFAGLENRGYQWYFGDRVSAGMVPTNDDQHCVFVAVPEACFAETFRGRMDNAFLEVAAANSAALRDQLERTEPKGRLRGYSAGAGFLRKSFGSGWALVGDAGYFKDPLTANGISDALLDAEILAAAIRRGSERDLARYEEERNAHAIPFLELTDEIASFTWDEPGIKELHTRLGLLMKAATRRVVEFDQPDTLAA
jgi:flavin-dependent dehydrogenase